FSRFVFFLFVHRLDLHSFPTRRSSDLCSRNFAPHSSAFSLRSAWTTAAVTGPPAATFSRSNSNTRASALLAPLTLSMGATSPCRSEEHTSELQSRENLVCRLLLEKKKN